MDERLLSNVVRWWRQKFARYPLFVVAGVAAFTSNLLITYLLTEEFGWWYLGSVVVGTVFSWIVFYVLNFYFTFPKRLTGRFWVGLGKNFVTQLLLAPVGWSLIYLATSILGIYYLLSLTLVVSLVSFVSFYLNKYFVFNSAINKF